MKERRKDTLILSWINSPGFLVTSNRIDINTKPSLCLVCLSLQNAWAFKCVDKSYNGCGVFFFLNIQVVFYMDASYYMIS